MVYKLVQLCCCGFTAYVYTELITNKNCFYRKSIPRMLLAVGLAMISYGLALECRKLELLGVW